MMPTPEPVATAIIVVFPVLITLLVLVYDHGYRRGLREGRKSRPKPGVVYEDPASGSRDSSML
jgi:hypothetical protein